MEERLAHSNATGAETNARCERLNQELQALATQNSQLRADLFERENRLVELEELTTQNSQLRAALSERNNSSIQIEGLTNQIAQVRAAWSERENDCERRIQQLREEVSERVNEGEQLRGRIDSIQASICWRLTGPIRWLHRQVIRAERKESRISESKTARVPFLTSRKPQGPSSANFFSNLNARSPMGCS